MRPKRHHYVPEWYQARFAREVEGKSLIYVYDKDAPTEGPRLQQPKNTGVEGLLYAFKDDAGQEISLEEDFAELENIVQPVIEQWIRPKHKPSDEEIGFMALFVGHMLGRSPRMIEMDAQFGDALSVAMMRDLAKRPEEQVKAFHELKAQGKLPGIDSPEELQDFLAAFEENFTIKFDRKYAMGQSIKIGHELVELLIDMNWCLLCAPSDAFFITSDCPVNMVFFSSDGKAGFGGGLSHPTAQVTFPLSPEVSILIDHRTNQRRRRVKEKVVADLNRRQAAKAERFVYSHRDTGQIRRWVQEFAYTRNQDKIEMEPMINRFESQLAKRQNNEKGINT